MGTNMSSTYKLKALVYPQMMSIHVKIGKKLEYAWCGCSRCKLHDAWRDAVTDFLISPQNRTHNVEYEDLLK